MKQFSRVTLSDVIVVSVHNAILDSIDRTAGLLVIVSAIVHLMHNKFLATLEGDYRSSASLRTSASLLFEHNG